MTNSFLKVHKNGSKDWFEITGCSRTGRRYISHRLDGPAWCPSSRGWRPMWYAHGRLGSGSGDYDQG